MKKTLLPISLCSCFGMAAAETSNVTVYGTVDAGVASVNGAAERGATVGLISGQQSYSRLGFRGNEDLGAGLSAIFVLEQGFSLSTGESGVMEDSTTGYEKRGQMFNSQSFVGLTGDFGTLKLGRQFTPLYEAYGAIDPFANGFAANINNFFGTTAWNASYYQRMSSAANYSTPNFGGFRAELAYGFGGVAGSIAAQSQFGASLRYANGPLILTYAYHHANAEALQVSTDQPAIDLPSFKTNFIGATVDLGSVKLHAAIDQNQQGDVFKARDYLIGLTVPFGANAVFADYTHKKVSCHSKADADQYAIGVTHSLSRRTNLYAAYTAVKNDDFSFIDTEVPGNSVSTIQLGLRHSF